MESAWAQDWHAYRMALNFRGSLILRYLRTFNRLQFFDMYVNYSFDVQERIYIQSGQCVLDRTCLYATPILHLQCAMHIVDSEFAKLFQQNVRKPPFAKI